VLRSKSDKELEDDYWLGRALWLAEAFDQDHYAKVIRDQTYETTLEQNRRLLNVPASNSGNEIFEGILLENQGDIVSLTLSWYMN